ncbi:DUF6580 family putative transport protein [Granulicella arctica]|uniref:DUF6580 family putative transport protein n=1 Tax=Granulicella arctica TaxID=940613 RepID=UPI0021DF5387|nr:DUF6580 family putative transport protein [Granulicella arctica]
MTAYVALLVAVLSRLLPHAFHTTSVGFTAVGGGLLFFGARRSRWQTVFAVLALMATDYYLTVCAYSYAFHASHYVVTWVWYAAVCLMGHQLLAGKPSALKVGGAVLASSTSFFILSNFALWAGGTLYAHTLAGLGTCFVTAIPFYANDAMSTAITAGALFGLPALAASIAESLHDGQIAKA